MVMNEVHVRQSRHREEQWSIVPVRCQPAVRRLRGRYCVRCLFMFESATTGAGRLEGGGNVTDERRIELDRGLSILIPRAAGSIYAVRSGAPRRGDRATAREEARDSELSSAASLVALAHRVDHSEARRFQIGRGEGDLGGGFDSS